MIENDIRKTLLRMIPYGLFILTAHGEDDRVAAATVNWVTQASFKPPLVAVAVRQDSFTHTLIQESGFFALNMLGKDQAATASIFFKPSVRSGMTLSGEPFHFGETGAPVFDQVPGWVECLLSGTLALGDHTLFVGEVVAGGLRQPISGRPDEAILTLRDLGGNLFYGG